MNARELLFFFAKEWKAKYGRSYPISFGREGAMLKGLLQDYSSEELISYIQHYLTKFNDPFVSQNGHSVGLLRVSLPKVIAEVSKDEAARAGAKDSEADFLKLEEARKRLGNE